MDPRRLLPALLVIAAVCVVMTVSVVALRPGGQDAAEARAASVSTPPAGARAPARVAREILAAWDGRRSRAWAQGDAHGLASLYLPASRAGAADVATLRRWRARGMRVVGLQTQVLDLEVTDQGQRRLELLVTDRMVGGEAVGPGGRRVRLPTDRASTRQITLERVGGRWLVAEVSDAVPR